jgi:hypothetical protein
MWLRAWREQPISRAISVVLVLVVCGSAVDWGHAGGDDPDCNVVFVKHDDAAHRFSAAPDPLPAGDHCYICHSLRLLHTALATRGERAAFTAQSIPLRIVVGHHAASALPIALSPRAPPLTL